MANITYRSVIAQAISDFNSIQNAIANKNVPNITQADSSESTKLLQTNLLPDYIKEYLVYANGNLPITNGGEFNVATAYEAGKNRTGYEKVTVPFAKNFGFNSLAPKATSVTVGDLSDGFYALSNTFSGEFQAGTAGWFTKASAETVGAISVGAIKKGSLNELGRAESEDGESLIITATYETGYLKKEHTDATKTTTISPAAFTVTNATNVFKSEIATSVLGGATNIHAKATLSETCPTSGYVIPIDITASSEGGITATSAGYVHNGKDIGKVTASGDEELFIKIDAATTELVLNDLTGTQDITQSVSKVTDAGKQSGSTNISALKKSSDTNAESVTGTLVHEEPTSGYYIAVQNAATSTTISATADATIKSAGYISADGNGVDNFTEATKTRTVSAAKTTSYISVAEAICSYSGGGLTYNNEFTPSLGLNVDTSSTSNVSIKDYSLVEEEAKGDAKFFIKLKATSEEDKLSVSRAETFVTHTAGFHAAGTKSALAADEAKIGISQGNKSKYIILPSAQLQNSLTATQKESDYTEITGIELTNGKLYISHGYIEDSYISLAGLIPDLDPSDIVSDSILAGFSGYDDAGNVVHGKIQNTTISNYYFTTDNTGFGALTHKTYINAAADYYIIAGTTPTVTMSGGSAVTPTISKSILATGETNANTSGATFGNILDATQQITTTKPTDKYYIAVKSSAESSKVTAETKGAKGWVDAYEHSDEVTVTVNSSGDYYVPVNKANIIPTVDSLVQPEVAITTTETGITTVSNSKFSVKVDAAETNGSVHAKYTVAQGGSGYISQGSTATTATSTTVNPVVKFGGNETDTKTIFIQEGSVSGGTLGVNVNNSTTANPSNAGYARTVASSETNYVKVVVNAEQVVVSEGYVDGSTTGMKSFTPTAKEVRIGAATNATVNAGAPANTVTISATSIYDQEGAVSKAYGTGAGETYYQTTVAIPVVNNETTDLNNKYIINSVKTQTSQGTTTVRVGEDTTGSMVDTYVEALYKRMMGRSYTEVSKDE